MLGAGALGALSHAGARRVLPLEETWRSALLLLSPDDIAGDESAHEQEGWPYFVFGCPLYLLGSSKLWGSATTRGGRCEIGRCGGITPHKARENGFLKDNKDFYMARVSRKTVPKLVGCCSPKSGSMIYVTRFAILTVMPTRVALL